MSKTSYQDVHLDLLIRMAFEQMEEEETEQLAASPDPEISTDNALRADAAFDKALQTVSGQHRREKQAKRTISLRRGLRMAGAIAAALIVLALIALPVTFAASAEFRNAVMKLFVEIDDVHKEAHFSFQPADQPTQEPVAAPSVPERWRGDYYPTYLPVGFLVDYISSTGTDIIWLNEGTEKIDFSELDEYSGVSAGTEGTTISKVSIHGNEGVMIAGYGYSSYNVSITWAIEDRWFNLTTYGLSEEEAIRIAESVQAVKRFPDRTTTAEIKAVIVPDFWKGKYYPAYIPSGFSITEYDEIFHSIEWQNDAEARIIYSEYDENIASVSGTDGAEITSIMIHGNDATLIDGYTDRVHCVTIVWAEEDRWFDLIFYGVDTSEAIRIAESVRGL